MNYGLIGEKLGHSFSAEIHAALGGYEYVLREVPQDGIEAFIKGADFKGINITIPYKERVIPYLDGIDEGARRIGAVNTVVKRNGALLGYNTDFTGLKALLRRVGMTPNGKKTLILGTGGTSKTAFAAVKALGGTEIYKVGRSGRGGALTYEEAYRSHADAAYIINTTPVGMYPDNDGLPVDISRFPALEGVADVVYNPLRTALVQAARTRGIASEGGLYMLVAQAVAASELFTDRHYDAAAVDSVFASLLKSKENIVLVGMPSSGKSTVGKLLAELTGKTFTDTDALIERAAERPAADIIKNEGEAHFRHMESDAVRMAAKEGGQVIATGGGAVLMPENRAALKQNGRLYFLDRPLELLMPTEDRPLARDAAALKKRYEERYDIYTSAADVRIENRGTPKEAADAVIKEFYGK